jgi:hypothetical protein
MKVPLSQAMTCNFIFRKLDVLAPAGINGGGGGRRQGGLEDLAYPDAPIICT